MAKQWKEVATIYLKGSRFNNGALDPATLSELQHFQEIVTSTAKAVWRKENPDHMKLPRNFEGRVRFYVRTIERGSICIPLEKDVESQGRVHSDTPRIEDTIREIAEDVPDEEWEKLPHNLTDRLDYYLYGVEEICA